MKMDEQLTLITLRKISRVVKERLRVRAAEHGGSMQAEAGCILEAALAPQAVPAGQHLYERVRARFGLLGGVDLDVPSRERIRPPPNLS